MNPYIPYYGDQIGKGIAGYKGMKRQKGAGVLLNLLTKSIVPFVQSTIKSVDPGKLVRMAGDLLGSPGLQPGRPIADDIARIGATAAGTLINTLQGGKGRQYKRKRRSKKKPVARKRCTKKRQKRVVKRRKLNTKKSLKQKRTAKKKSAKKRTTTKRNKWKLRDEPLLDLF